MPQIENLRLTKALQCQIDLLGEFRLLRRMARSCWIGVLAATVLLAQSNSQQSPPTLSSDPEVEKRIDSILSRMTLEQKIDLLSGIKSFYIRGYKELGLPEQKMSDGPVGVRNYGPATTMGGIGLAASWNPELVERMAKVYGEDARARGVHFLLGPGVNIHRA